MWARYSVSVPRHCPPRATHLLCCLVNAIRKIHIRLVPLSFLQAAPMTRRGKHPPATPHDVADTHQAAGGAAAATQPPPTAGSVTPTATSHERGGAGVGMGAAPAAAPGTAPEGVAGRVDEGVVAQAAKGLCTVGAGGPVPPSDTEGAAEGARRGGGAGVPAATFG